MNLKFLNHQIPVKYKQMFMHIEILTYNYAITQLIILNIYNVYLMVNLIKKNTILLGWSKYKNEHNLNPITLIFF